MQVEQYKHHSQQNIIPNDSTTLDCEDLENTIVRIDEVKHENCHVPEGERKVSVLVLNFLQASSKNFCHSDSVVVLVSGGFFSF